MSKKNKSMDKIPDAVREFLILAKILDTQKLEMLACKALELESTSTLPDHLKEEAREIMYLGFYICQVLNIVREKIDIAFETVEDLLENLDNAFLDEIDEELEQFFEKNPEMECKLDELMEIYDDLPETKH